MNLLSPQWIMVWFMLLVIIGFAHDRHRIDRLERRQEVMGKFIASLHSAMPMSGLVLPYDIEDDKDALL